MGIFKQAHKLKSLFSRFGRNHAGVAAVEFALIMPFMILLFFGTLEASRALAYDRRLTSASSALGDLIAQTNTSLSMTQLNDYFTAARITMVPYNAELLRQTATCVYVDADGDATVTWSYANNGATAHATGSAYALPTAFTDIARDTYVIVAEAELFYEPITNIAFDTGITLYKEQFYIPRFGGLISVL